MLWCRWGWYPTPGPGWSRSLRSVQILVVNIVWLTWSSRFKENVYRRPLVAPRNKLKLGQSAHEWMDLSWLSAELWQRFIKFAAMRFLPRISPWESKYQPSHEACVLWSSRYNYLKERQKIVEELEGACSGKKRSFHQTSVYLLATTQAELKFFLWKLIDDTHEKRSYSLQVGTCDLTYMMGSYASMVSILV